MESLSGVSSMECPSLFGSNMVWGVRVHVVSQCLYGLVHVHVWLMCMPAHCIDVGMGFYFVECGDLGAGYSRLNHSF